MYLLATDTFDFSTPIERGYAYVEKIGVFFPLADNLGAFFDKMKRFFANMPHDFSAHALEQPCQAARVRICDKRYADQFFGRGQLVTLVGVIFDGDHRTIAAWKAKKAIQ